LTLYALLAIGGFLLFRSKKKGIIISVIAQIFQIPYIVTSSCIYWFSAGFQAIIRIVIESHSVKISGNYFWGCFYRIFFGNDVRDIMIGINFIPIIIILYLWKIKKSINNNQIEHI
jgi:hypothetical protein